VKVTLLPELFVQPVQNTLLITLLHHPIEDRHRVELEIRHPAVQGWLADQAPGLREEIEIALDLSVRAEALEPSRIAVEVGRAGRTDYFADPIRVPLNDASRCVGERGPFA
jgi:hypothetical protein